VSGSDKRAALPQLTASYSCGKLKLNGRHADILATILAKMCVSVSAPCNSSLTLQAGATAQPVITVGLQVPIPLVLM